MFVSYVVTLLDRTTIFEWYMAKLVIEKEHSKDVWYDEIGLCAQNMNTFLSPIIHNIEGTCTITQREGELSLQPLITFVFQLYY